MGTTIPVFLEPAAIKPKIDDRDQDVFNHCGECADCENMLDLGLVVRLA